jgi:hypothetical protein
VTAVAVRTRHTMEAEFKRPRSAALVRSKLLLLRVLCFSPLLQMLEHAQHNGPSRRLILQTPHVLALRRSRGHPRLVSTSAEHLASSGAALRPIIFLSVIFVKSVGSKSAPNSFENPRIRLASIWTSAAHRLGKQGHGLRPQMDQPVSGRVAHDRLRMGQKVRDFGNRIDVPAKREDADCAPNGSCIAIPQEWASRSEVSRPFRVGSEQAVRVHTYSRRGVTHAAL